MAGWINQPPRQTSSLLLHNIPIHTTDHTRFSHQHGLWCDHFNYCSNTKIVENNILIISTSKEIQGFKKLTVKVTYTNDLNLITTKDESIVTAIQEIILDTVTFKSLDKSKLFLNVNAGNFNLLADDKSKIELNLKSETAFVELSKNSSLKALINSAELKCDLYQKSSAIIEGDSDNSMIRIDNLACYIWVW